jgi:UDP-N-acetylglucosamine:LPS N-acetylglucosamine transferase
MRILVSGGGTGGHIYPILAVVSALRALQAPSTSLIGPMIAQPPAGTPLASTSGVSALSAAAGQLGKPAAAPRPDAEDSPARSQVEIRYVGEAGGLEEELARQASIPFHAVASGQIRGRAPWVMARNLMRMGRGAQQSAALIREFRPDVAFITGGYVAAPLAWAASRARPKVPLLIYLPDLTPGQAIHLTSRLAAAVAVSFPEVAPYFPSKAVVTGYPVRAELLLARKDTARAALHLDAALTLLLVFGGSRGAHSINQALLAALPQLLPICQVLHISGQLDWPAIGDAGKRRAAEWAAQTGGSALRYHPYPYLHDEMVQALAAADLVIARAGASVLGEFPAVGLPSILVPYPYAGQHQDANAAYLADRGAALVVPDGELVSRLAPSVLSLFTQPERLAAMAAATRALARPEAAAAIAQELRQLAGVTM